MVLFGEDQQSLPGANVFIANTSKGTQTDADGKFELSDLPQGNYKLIISFVGFESLVVDIKPQEGKFYKIILKPVSSKLSEVVVKARRMGRSEWANNLRTFKANFIGESENAKNCVIKNSNVLHFTWENEILSASASDLLIIENPVLGYELKFLLEEFSYNKLLHKIFYKGQVVYKPMMPKDEIQKNTWAQNRLKAYNGSELHFMRSIYRRCLVEEGFVFNLFEDKNVRGLIEKAAVADTSLWIRSHLFKKSMFVSTLYRYNRILKTDSLSSEKTVLFFNGLLEVDYIHEEEAYDYLKTKDPRHVGSVIPQKSRLIIHNDGIEIEPNGNLISEEFLESQGYWSWEMVGESLPVDYEPEKDRQLTTPEK